MASLETPSSQEHGQRNVLQHGAGSQGYQVHEDPNVTDPVSPATSEAYWNSLPIHDPSSRDHEAPEPLSHYDAPEVVPGTGPEVVNPHYDPQAQLHEKGDDEPHDATKDPTTGATKRSRKIIIIVIAVVVIVGVALGLGLGFGLKKKSTVLLNQTDPNNQGSNRTSSAADTFCHDNPKLCIGGALGDEYSATKGAFNGSGISLAGETWVNNQLYIFTLFFQHWTGDIRYMRYTADQKWSGGTSSETVATDAKNATAISAVAYNLNDTTYYQLLYVSKENVVKEIIHDNTSGIWDNLWSPGPLSKRNLPTYDTPGTVGFQACRKESFYDYPDFQKAQGDLSTVEFENRRAVNIWVATDESTFQQYFWSNEKPDTWTSGDRWQGKNTHAGVGCYSWGEGSTSYTMMVNQGSSAEIWWRDTANMTGTAKHPTQSWVNSTKGLIPDVWPTFSLAYTTYLYAQMADRSINGFNISYSAENTTIVPEDTFTLADHIGPVKGIGGTHLTVTAFTMIEDDHVLWDSLYVFYQTEGNDITVFTRPIKGGGGRMKCY